MQLTIVNMYFDVFEITHDLCLYVDTMHKSHCIISSSLSYAHTDGRPPAIPLTVTHSNVHSVTVQWSTVLVPPGGDIQHYLAKLYSESDSLISSTQVNNINALSHTFGGLLSNTNYKVRIIGVNKYGSGNETTLLPVRTVISQSKNSIKHSTIIILRTSLYNIILDLFKIVQFQS